MKARSQPQNKKLQLVEHQEGNEDWADQTDYSGRNRTVRYDDAHYSGKERQDHLNQHVDNGVIRIHQRLHYAWTARCLGLIQDAQDVGQALIADDRDEILRTAVDEAP